MSAQQIGSTSGTWSKIKNSKRWKASYRVDAEKSGAFTPVILWRHEQQAEQQTTLILRSTRELAAAAAERILAQLGYRQEDAT